jgi:carbonic anhydrase/acetyltransferase-like protein (isoleucine patch superfamily)
MDSSNIYSFDGKAPRIDADAYVHPSACIIGDVRIGRGCFVGPHASLRGDNGSIRLDPMCNVQDNCVLHCCPGGTLVLHRFAQVGHGAVLHGCSLMENCLVGIHATVLDGAIIGQDTLVAAHSLVTKGARLDDGALYAGSPARFVKLLSLEAISALHEGALHYVQMARDYRTRLEPVGPHRAGASA